MAEEEPIVLGRELAAARAAEARHQVTGPSPLEGIAYGAGELDMFRLVPSDGDEHVAAVVAAQPAVADLTMGDFYTLAAFARRCVLKALRGDRAQLDAAAAAVALLDPDRMDWRDAAVNRDLVDWARGGKAGPGMWTPIETPDGPALADTGYRSYKPTRDLVAIAFAVIALLERDVYRAESLTVATDISDVWLTEPAGRPRAVVSLNGGLDDRAQMLLVYVIETKRAGTIAASAQRRPDFAEIIGVADGDLAAVMIARSTVAEVATREPAHALDRFAEPLRAALRTPLT